MEGVGIKKIVLLKIFDESFFTVASAFLIKKSRNSKIVIDVVTKCETICYNERKADKDSY